MFTLQAQKLNAEDAVACARAVVQNPYFDRYDVKYLDLQTDTLSLRTNGMSPRHSRWLRLCEARSALDAMLARTVEDDMARLSQFYLRLYVPQDEMTSRGFHQDVEDDPYQLSLTTQVSQQSHGYDFNVLQFDLEPTGTRRQGSALFRKEVQLAQDWREEMGRALLKTLPSRDYHVHWK